MTVVIETTDVEVAYQTVSSLYNVRRLTAPGERSFLRIEQDALGPADLHRLIFAMECGVDADPLGALYLGHVADGKIAYHSGRESRAYGAGDVFLAVQPDLPFRADIGRADLEFAVLDVSLLSQVAGTAPARKAEPVRFTAYRPATPRDVGLWLSTYQFVRGTFTAMPGGRPAPLAAGAAARLLAATALSVFPNNALLDPTAVDRNDARPATLRRAISFIDDNAHRDITLADIAAAAHVTIRALQLAFRRHLDCTPTAYLRRVRLERAHGQLSAADPGRESVTAVAFRWGFASSSRFAAYYREAYGVPPGATLRR